MSLTAGEIASMRETASDYLPGTAVIHRYTSVPDGQGGSTDTYGPIGTVSCRISPLYGSEPVRGDRLTTIQGRALTVPANTSIIPKDRVVESGTTYEVVNVDSPRSYEITRRAEIAEID